MTRVCFWSCIVLAGLASPGAQACAGDPFSLHWGDSIAVGMRVKASENCRFGFKAGGGNHVASVAVAQAPQHGTLTQADATHFFYRPIRGYTGPDVLKIKATGDLMGNRHIWSGDMDLTYNVQVVP